MRKSNKYTDEQFVEAVASSHTIRQVARTLGLHAESSGNYRTIKGKIERLQLDTSHFYGRAWSKHHDGKQTKPLEQFLSHGHASNRVKKRLLKERLLENKCKLCGTGDQWNGMPLVLQLDHIDGNNQNNDLNNLRILCPNCHSQTPTFTSKKQL